MLKVTVNGREEKLNIGCRTMISLKEILTLLNTDARNISLNGESISTLALAKNSVTGGDILELE